MSPQSLKSRPLSYEETMDVLEDADVQEDVNDACTRLVQAMSLLVQRFNTIARQLHSVDLQRLAGPSKPRWDGLSKEYARILDQYRANAGCISARLKLFYTAVLPVVARQSPGGRTRRSHDEATYVLQSFMSITAEHARQTRTLLEATVVFLKEMVVFHTAFSQIAYHQASSGKEEIKALSLSLGKLEAQVLSVCGMNMSLAGVGPVYPAFAISRLVSGLGKRPSRSRISVSLTKDMSKITKTFESMSTTQSEFAHALYCAQTRTAPTHLAAQAQISIAALVSDAMQYFEGSLTLFFADWFRLQADCCTVARWIDDPDVEAPVVDLYQKTGKALHVTLAKTLDVYCGGLDCAKGLQNL